MAFAWRAAGLSYAPPLPRPLPYPDILQHRYNRFLQIASRVVRRSLKDEQRLIAEKRGEMDLRFAKWEVSRDHPSIICARKHRRAPELMHSTGRKAGRGQVRCGGEQGGYAGECCKGSVMIARLGWSEWKGDHSKARGP